MTTETVLTPEQMAIIRLKNDDDFYFASAIEQAVLQSEQVQAWKKDAERYRWLKENIQPEYDLPGGYYLPDEDTSTWDGTIDASMEDQS